MKKTIIIILIFLLTPTVIVFGAYLENVPITVTQPDGTILKLFATGDEYYNWMHDENGYTVVINPKTKYYCYAILKNDELVASSNVVGKTVPQKIGLKPKINLTVAKMNETKRKVYDYMHENETQKSNFKRAALKSAPTTQSSFSKINNIVIFIRFADQTEFETAQNYYTSIFNGTSTGVSSMRNYFKEASYGNLDINTTFYPVNNGTKVLSYQDIYESGYYMTTNESEIGYRADDFEERTKREHNLLCRAIDYVKSQIPTSLDIDNDNNGYVDNICFIVKGNTTAWSTLLWPHKWQLYSRSEYINGKRVYYYNFQIENHLKAKDVGVLCHEMNHTLGAPDLYHNDNVTPIGAWCLMSHDQNPPQHMCAYVKYKYDGWIQEIPEITKSGTYSLNPLVKSTNNCYKISIKGSEEYLVLEYRKKEGTFEKSVYGSGLVVYRINEKISGNPKVGGHGGENDMIYVFRPNGSLHSEGDISVAFLSAQTGRDSFNNNSNPYCFTSNGNKGNIYIKNITESNGKITFDVRFCDGADIVKSNTSNLPQLTNASRSITTQNVVTVKSTDNITFEAGNEVTLNAGFEVKLGGKFEINMNDCGDK